MRATSHSFNAAETKALVRFLQRAMRIPELHILVTTPEIISIRRKFDHMHKRHESAPIDDAP
jgi:hypothetical protein